MELSKHIIRHIKDDEAELFLNLKEQGYYSEAALFVVFNMEIPYWIRAELVRRIIDKNTKDLNEINKNGK